MSSVGEVKAKVVAGRQAIDAYRTAHIALHSKPWHKGIPEEHTPLLIAMVNALDGLGFTSTQTGFEDKNTEILAKFWDASDLVNIQELGFVDKEDFEAKATEADREALMEMWH